MSIDSTRGLDTFITTLDRSSVDRRLSATEASSLKGEFANLGTSARPVVEDFVKSRWPMLHGVLTGRVSVDSADFNDALKTRAQIREPLDERIKRAYENCTRSNWNLESQLRYLDAAQQGAAKLRAFDPEDRSFDQLTRDISRDVVAKAYERCTGNNWNLSSKIDYAFAAQAAHQAKVTLGESDPSSAQLVRDTGNDARNAGYQNCVDKGWNAASKIDYARAAQASYAATKVLGSPDSAAAQLVRDTARDANDAGYKSCTENNWNLDSYRLYFRGTSAAAAGMALLGEASNYATNATNVANDIRTKFRVEP